MNSLKLWLTLRVHGRKAYEELIDRQLALTEKFAEWVRTSEAFELAARPTLPIVTFRLKSFELNPKQLAAAHGSIVEEVTSDGQRWISETFVNGQSVIRMMVISYLTEECHLQDLELALTRAARDLITHAKVG
jgi:aromatic-L-amino-acid/L-tryptophan decarboxylase